jgi:hypothetical protein
VDHSIEVLGTLFFAIAILHTFVAPKIAKYAHHFPKGSPQEGLLHLLGEIEIVFGLWATVFMLLFGAIKGIQTAVKYQEGIQFTEPIFVFCIMVIAATKPVLWLAQKLSQSVSAVLAKATRVPQTLMDVFTLLVLGTKDVTNTTDNGDLGLKFGFFVG